MWMHIHLTYPISQTVFHNSLHFLNSSFSCFSTVYVFEEIVNYVATATLIKFSISMSVKCSRRCDCIARGGRWMLPCMSCIIFEWLQGSLLPFRILKSPDVLVRNTYRGGRWMLPCMSCIIFEWLQGSLLPFRILKSPDVPVRNTYICRYI